MERAKQVAAFWPWLPTFRAVAEVEHLGQAAQSLGVSSSAVSRTIGLLEEELGVELLAREGRGLRLTEAGRILQTAVRDAMRTVHEASGRFERSSFHGELRVSTVSPATEAHLHPVLSPLRSRYPGLRLSMTSLPFREVRSALLQGQVDVALLRTEVKPDGISVRRLSTQRPKVYAPASVSLPQRRRYSFQSLEEYSFVALDDVHGDDPYPLSESRRVVFSAETFEESLQVARVMSALVVLPESLAQPFLASCQLREVPTPALRPMHCCVAWRNPLALLTSADQLVELLVGT